MDFEKAKDLLRFLIRRSIHGFESPTSPHFDPASLQRFNKLLESCESYAEFGTGGSTVRTDELGKPCFSVESDKVYAKAVKRGLSSESTVHLEWVNVGIVGFWGTPIFRKVTGARHKRWSKYANAPFTRGDERYDFVLVDGRFRRACALAAIRNAQKSDTPCTVMFDDYFHRPYYFSIEEVLGKPEEVGRAAIFRSQDALREISSSEITEASKDYR